MTTEDKNLIKQKTDKLDDFCCCFFAGLDLEDEITIVVAGASHNELMLHKLAEYLRPYLNN